jgi:PadR family transcriptional regulator PadR
MDCRHIGGLPKNFLQPCLLLLLKEQPGYGYDLVSRLKVLGIDDDSASVYRALRSLEDGGAVSSYWNTTATGPARRMYRLTPWGEDTLEESARAFQDTHSAIERYLCRYALVAQRSETPACPETPPARRPNPLDRPGTR